MKNKIFDLKILNDCKELFILTEAFICPYIKFKYNLSNHILKTTISIGSNIAEANYYKDKKRNFFLDIAYNSCNEFLFQIELYNKKDNNYNKILNLIDKIQATIYKLKNSKFGVRSSEFG